MLKVWIYYLLEYLSLESRSSRSSSRSQMFFKIGALKNFALLEPLFNKDAGLLLQNTHCGWFWIFASANTFFQLNLVFIADSRTGFCSGLLWKHKLNLRSSHWSCSVKKVVLRNFAKVYRKTPVLKSLFTRVSFYENFIKKGLQRRCFPWNLRSF